MRKLIFAAVAGATVLGGAMIAQGAQAQLFGYYERVAPAYHYDSYGRRYPWNEQYRRYWEGRRGAWGQRNWNDQRWQRWDGYRGRTGTGTWTGPNDTGGTWTGRSGTGGYTPQSSGRSGGGGGHWGGGHGGGGHGGGGGHHGGGSGRTGH